MNGIESVAQPDEDQCLLVFTFNVNLCQSIYELETSREKLPVHLDLSDRIPKDICCYPVLQSRHLH